MPVTPDSALLFYAESGNNPDMRYFSGIHVPDPFIAFRIKGKKTGIFNALEYGRALKQSTLDHVLPLEPFRDRARERWPDVPPGPADIITIAAADLGVDRFTVPDDFPAGLFEKLRQRGLLLDVAGGPVLPSREFKTPAETRAISAGNRIAAIGIAAAEKALAVSRIKGAKILYRGEPLTSERLKFVIETACLEAGGVSLNTIAAGGDQACAPHHRGSGLLRPNELIIVDVFPQENRTGFHGDMTRTFLKGKANDAQHKLYDAVHAAQRAAFKRIRHGANGRDVHQACVDVFSSRGYETKTTPTGSIGFFHGTGHGLGLAVHELPRMSSAIDSTLNRGSVVTVEPGLYYPGLGGCRIEDVVQVTDGRPKKLSSFHYNWQIR